ncbi:hypothetical protein [Polaromonas sp.]|jgi:hypothetical protein|nr:hypothetical protein [Polaromonas sp.]HQS92670.1 hypothetical protein [Polaromonas sp.]
MLTLATTVKLLDDRALLALLGPWMVAAFAKVAIRLQIGVALCR